MIAETVDAWNVIAEIVVAKNVGNVGAAVGRTLGHYKRHDQFYANKSTI